MIRARVWIYKTPLKISEGESDTLWEGAITAVPRVGDFVSIDRDDGSLIVERVDYDFTVSPTLVEIKVT